MDSGGSCKVIKYRKNQTIFVKPTSGAVRPARITSVTSQTSLTVSYNKGATATVTVAANSGKTHTPKLASE
jgi:hypothetical protein